MNDTIKSLLKSVAPTLATALSGPLAGVAVRSIANEVLGTPDADEAAVEAYLGNMTSADLAKLKAAELEFQARLKEANVKLEEVHASDRVSARDRAARMKDWTPSILGAVILIGFFTILAYIMKFGLPETGQEVVTIVLGILGGLCTQVGNYFFGSSAGSASKNQIIERLKGSSAK